MKKIEFEFWTDLCRCGGCGVGSRVTIELSDEDAKLFKDCIPAFKDYKPDDYFDENGNDDWNYNRGMIPYFYRVLPEDLAKAIRKVIRDSLERYMTEDAIEYTGDMIYEDSIKPNTDITEEEWEEMDMEKKIDLTIEYDPSDMGAVDYEVVSINILSES
ncbi:MAG: hypothetical protein HUK12_00495 [Muribaculaceae bacterium]|nr:hypothetical protein [Muribaculaceae bacterium]